MPEVLTPIRGTETNAAPVLPKSEYLSRSCPNCESQATDPNVRIQAERPAEDRSFDEIKKTWQHFFKTTSFFSYFRCYSCQQLYCPVFFDFQQLTLLYSRMSDNTANV